MLRWPRVDGFYATSSLALFLAALIGLRKKTGLSTFQREAIAVAALSFIMSVGFLALLSIQVRLWQLHKPLAAAPVFHIGPIAERRTHSIRAAVRLWHFISVPSHQCRIAFSCPRRDRRVCDSVGDHH